MECIMVENRSVFSVLPVRGQLAVPAPAMALFSAPVDMTDPQGGILSNLTSINLITFPRNRRICNDQ